jgi:putative membrane protein
VTEAQLRDNLAVERTRLANERTLLAYVRTALALAGGGAAVLHFFPHLPSLLLTGWALIVTGGATLSLGIYRFAMVRRRIGGKVG